MPASRAIEPTIARAVLSRPGAGRIRLPRLVARPGANPYGRLAIYRNNTYASLTTVLLTVFPVTAALIDERYFRYLAHGFIAASPPAEARLARYGRDFPAYLAGIEALGPLPFVAETARLEWEIAVALDLASTPPLAMAALTGLPAPEAARLGLQPSLRLLVSRWPVLSIWSAHQGRGEPDMVGLARRRPERLAVWRAGWNIRMAALAPVELKFVRALARGDTLENAALKALGRDPLFDLAAALARLFGNGLVTHVNPEPLATPEILP